MFNKKTLVIGSIAIALVCAVFIFNRWMAGPKTTGLPMKIARNYWPGMYWVDVADKKGWFKEAGLNVEIIDTNADYFASLNDMVAGKIDEQNFALFDVLSYNNKGVELVMVVNTDTSFGTDAIVAKKEIENIAALKGKKVGLAKNTYFEYLLGTILERSGLRLADVVIIDISAENAPREFIKGTVDAVVTWEPFVTEAVQKGQGVKLWDTSEIPGISPAGVVLHRSFIDQRPTDVQALVNVWHKATGFIKENPKEAYRIVAEVENKTPEKTEELAQLDKILDLNDNLLSFTYSKGFESLHGAAFKINNYMIKKGMIDKELDTTRFIDGSFIQNIRGAKDEN